MREAVREFTDRRTFQEYLDDRAFRSSVEREMITIEEVLRWLREMDPSLLIPVPNAHQIIAIRHVLVHRYLRVDHEIVWDAVANDIPQTH